MVRGVGKVQPLVQEHRDKTRGVIVSLMRKKQGRDCERSGMEVSASEPVCGGDEQFH